MFRKLIFIWIIVYPFLYAQDTTGTAKTDSLKAIIVDMQKRLEALELKELRREAFSVKKENMQRRFTEKSRSLQLLNPELSVTGDFFAKYLQDAPHFTSSERSGLGMRLLGIHWQSALDPYSMMKVAVEFSPEGVEVAEAYVIWNGILPGLGMRVGKMRQEFGAINRWHEHALEQFDFPLVLQQVFGEEGLYELSLALDLNLPSFLSPLTQNLVISLMNGTNEALFHPETFHFPAVSGHVKNFIHISEDAYLDVGFSGVWGQNHFDGYVNGIRQKDPTTSSYVVGTDLSVVWEPTSRSLYRNIIWRNELIYGKKELPGNQTISLWGGYSYVQSKLSRRWIIGFRLDYTQPFTRNNSDIQYIQYVPYITWWQSEFVRIRLQANLKKGDLQNESSVFMIQITWAAGPHKHEKY